MDWKIALNGALKLLAYLIENKPDDIPDEYMRGQGDETGVDIDELLANIAKLPSQYKP